MDGVILPSRIGRPELQGKKIADGGRRVCWDAIHSMKSRSLIAPLLATAGVGVWLGTTQLRIQRAQDQTRLLQQRLSEGLATGSATSGVGMADGVAAKSGREGNEDPLDWRKIGEALADAGQGGMPDLRAYMDLQARLVEMDGDDIVAALEEIAALDLPAELRQGLETMLIANLAEKDPQLALERYLDRMGESRGMAVSWSLAQAFGKWLEKDPEAAGTWFDDRIAAGDFDSKSLDGRSDDRLRFESALIGKWLKSDPAAAGERLKMLPEEQRDDVLRQGGFSNLAKGSEEDFARLVRDNFPEEDRGGLLAHGMSARMQQGGYEEVSAFLDQIDATGSERKDVAKNIVVQKLQGLAGSSEVRRPDVDEMRAWLGKEAPEDADRITGEALGGLWMDGMERRAEMVVQLSEEGGGDAVLAGFIETGQVLSQRDLARRLAEKIRDPGERERLLERIGPVETEER